MTDTRPHVSPREIGRLPTVIVNVKLPREFPLRLLAALFARAGRLKWVHRPRRDEAQKVFAR
jgi:hypothetical protein